MTFWRTFHSINEDLAFICGFTLNMLLLMVIKVIKVKAMKKYNILLFQCCCVDMLQVIISFLVKPAMVVHKRNLYHLSNGFLRPMGGLIEMIGIMSWGISVFFCICSMPVSYIFRYRALCLNSEISKKFYIISLTVAFLSASTFGLIQLKFHYIDNRHMTYLAENSFGWLMADDEGKVKAAIVCFSVSFITLLTWKTENIFGHYFPFKSYLNNLYLFLQVTICSCELPFQGSFGLWLTITDAFVITFIPYLIMIICKIKISAYLRNYQHCLSFASKRVQSDLNLMLTAQAIIPIFFAFLPVGLHIFSILIDINLVFETFIGGILYCWIPVGNAISVLAFVTPYRKKLLQLFLCRRQIQFPPSVSATTTHG